MHTHIHMHAKHVNFNCKWLPTVVSHLQVLNMYFSMFSICVHVHVHIDVLGTNPPTHTHPWCWQITKHGITLELIEIIWCLFKDLWSVETLPGMWTRVVCIGDVKLHRFILSASKSTRNLLLSYPFMALSNWTSKDGKSKNSDFNINFNMEPLTTIFFETCP